MVQAPVQADSLHCLHPPRVKHISKSNLCKLSLAPIPVGCIPVFADIVTVPADQHATPRGGAHDACDGQNCNCV